MHDRRMFLQTGAALALPAIGGVLIAEKGAVLGAAVDAACATCSDDPVLAEAMRQFKAAVRSLAKSPRGEQARQAAAALRIIAAHARSKNLDAEFRRAVDRQVKKYGRDSVLVRPFDREQFAAAAREFGVSPVPVADVPVSARREALDALLAGGVTAHLLQTADDFDAAAAEIDARGPVQRATSTTADCESLRKAVEAAEAAMVVACLFGTGIVCAVLAGAYLGLLGAYLAEC